MPDAHGIRDMLLAVPMVTKVPRSEASRTLSRRVA